MSGIRRPSPADSVLYAFPPSWDGHHLATRWLKIPFAAIAPSVSELIRLDLPEGAAGVYDPIPPAEDLFAAYLLRRWLPEDEKMALGLEIRSIGDPIRLAPRLAVLLKRADDRSIHGFVLEGPRILTVATGGAGDSYGATMELVFESAEVLEP